MQLSDPTISIETHDLCREYKSYIKPEGLINSIKGFWDRKHQVKTALKPTNIKIEYGKIVGLVGANGAGKTTLLKILSGLIHPTSGDASVLGFKPWERQDTYLKQMSILLGQKNQLWWDISPVDSYALLARIYDLDLISARKRVSELAKILQCEHVLEVQLRRLSLGERMKMEIIGSLLHEPKILFLDEPTIGLDLVAQETIRDFLSTYVKNNSPTVILTSHYMDDITKLADRLLLISQGQIVYDGTVDKFVRESQTHQKILVRFEVELTADYELRLASSQDVLRFTKGKKEFQFKVISSDLKQVLPFLSSVGIVHDLKIEETDFEDVIRGFLQTESRVF